MLANNHSSYLSFQFHFTLLGESERVDITNLSPISHRRSSEGRSSLVVKSHIGWALWCGKQQDLPCACRGRSRVESLIARTGDDHYLVVLTQINTSRV